jgi:hypothetical protein
VSTSDTTRREAVIKAREAVSVPEALGKFLEGLALELDEEAGLLRDHRNLIGDGACGMRQLEHELRLAARRVQTCLVLERVLGQALQACGLLEAYLAARGAR